MEKISFFFLFSFISLSGMAQPEPFLKTFGTEGLTHRGLAAEQLPSGNIFYLGDVNADSIGGWDIILYKLDEEGNELWAKCFGTPANDFASKMVFHENKFYVVGHVQSGFLNNGIVWIIDTLGNQIGSTLVGFPPTSETLVDIAIDMEGNVIVAGFVNDPNGEGNDTFYAKLTPDLGLIWWKKYELTRNNVAYAIKATQENNYMISLDEKMEDDSYRITIILTDPLGDVIWDLILDDGRNSGCKGAIVNENNEFVIVGERAGDNEPVFDALLSVVNSAGDVLLHDAIQFTPAGEAAFDLFELPNLGYAICGYGQTSDGQAASVFLVDQDGQLIGREDYISGTINIGYNIRSGNSNGTFIMAGTSLDKNILVFDFLPNYENLNLDNAGYPLDWKVYPNPSTGESVTIATNSFASGALYSAYGNLIKEFNLVPGKNEVHFNLSSGIYYMETKSREGRHYSQKLVVIHP